MSTAIVRHEVRLRFVGFLTRTMRFVSQRIAGYGGLPSLARSVGRAVRAVRQATLLQGRNMARETRPTGAN